MSDAIDERAKLEARFPELAWKIIRALRAAGRPMRLKELAAAVGATDPGVFVSMAFPIRARVIEKKERGIYALADGYAMPVGREA